MNSIQCPECKNHNEFVIKGECYACDGRGKVFVGYEESMFSEQVPIYEECRICNGMRRIKSCEYCRGRGYVFVRIKQIDDPKMPANHLHSLRMIPDKFRKGRRFHRFCPKCKGSGMNLTPNKSKKGGK